MMRWAVITRRFQSGVCPESTFSSCWWPGTPPIAWLAAHVLENFSKSSRSSFSRPVSFAILLGIA